MSLNPDFDARLRPGLPERRRWAQEDELIKQIEAAYSLSAYELAETYGDKFILFLNDLVEQQFISEREDDQWPYSQQKGL